MRSAQSVLAASVVAIATAFSGAAASSASGTPGGAQIDPNAGAWQTWVLTSGSQFRPPPPPDTAATAGETAQLESLTSQRDAAALSSIQYWDAGAPGYRCNQILADEFSKHGVSGGTSSRIISLLEVGIYDATIATWDAKYAYNRSRPNGLDPSLKTVVATPLSPSYPSEHAVVGTAAADVLAYFFPDDSDALTQKAIESGQSRVIAGVQFPSDVSAGVDLGHQVAAAVVDRAKHDGTEIAFAGSFSNAPDKWSLRGYPEGTNIAGPNFGDHRTWVLSSGSQVRPAAPPPIDSAEMAANVAELKDLQRTFAMSAAAFFWQTPVATSGLYFIQVADQKILENRLDADPPRAARVQALTSIAGYDSAVACWNAKFTFLVPRPFQLDPDVHPLFQTPAQPSYPAADACLAGSEAGVLGHLFPSDADALGTKADEAGMARIWAGIHTRSDIDAGIGLGQTVARMVVEHAQNDGAE